ncbi:MAG: T9SS type A sorting domain-containing protein [Dehalococcoidia bacterium]|nr:T9SS type A sorting domain-containing protein [Dehalococcoidia bacterium]
MSKIRHTVMIGLLLLVGAAVVAAACTKPAASNGTIQGGVTIGPVFPGPVSIGDNRAVPPEVFAARKVVIYDSSGKNLVQTVDIRQADQGANGYYVVQLKPGTYVVDLKKNGIDHAQQVPKTVTVTAGQVVTVDIDIDTGIR